MNQVSGIAVDEREGAARPTTTVTLVTVARLALLLLAGAHLVAFVVVAVRRSAHPFELEWMEGAMVAHVDRMLHGQRLYVAPTLDFVPFIYGPVYFWTAALLAKVIGLGFAPLRLVSIAASCGCFGLIHALVARETRDRAAGVVAAGAFAGSYVHGAQFLDLARVDALALFFVLAALFVLRHRPARLPWRLLVAALLGLSFMTKQSMLLVAVAALVWAAVTERRRALPFVVATPVATLGFAVVVDVVHDGWFRYYAWELPRGHAFVKEAVAGFWVDDLLPRYAIAAVAAGWWLLGAPRGNRAALFYTLMSAGLVGGAWSGRLHDGGWPNVLIPAFAALSILFGLGFSAASADATSVAGPLGARRARFVVAVALAQLAVLVYDPARVLPKRRDVVAGEAFVARLRALDGDVYLPDHSWYAHLAGKRTFAHHMAIDDVVRGDPGGEGPTLAVTLRHAIEARRWSAIVLDGDWYEDVVRRSYREGPRPFAEGDPAFFPVTGIHIRPVGVFVRE